MCLIGFCDFSCAVGGVGPGVPGQGNFIYDYCCSTNKYICFFVSIIDISWSGFKFLSFVTVGRGYGGPMQPGVFHGYPLKSPKVQGVAWIYTVIVLFRSFCSHDMTDLDVVNVTVLFSPAYRQSYSPYGLITRGHLYGHRPKVFYGGFITGWCLSLGPQKGSFHVVSLSDGPKKQNITSIACFVEIPTAMVLCSQSCCGWDNSKCCY